MSRALVLYPLIVLVLSLAAAPRAEGQDLELTAYGLRSGLSLDDDLFQLLIGGQVDLGRLAENVRLQPFVTAGVGDDAVTLLLAAEAHYLFPVQSGSRIEPYAGGGLGIHHIDYDESGADTEVALLLAGGFDAPVGRWWGYFVEGRFVVADDVVFRAEAGINWRY